MLPSDIGSLVLAFTEKVDASEDHEKESGEQKNACEKNEHLACLSQSITSSEQDGAVIHLKKYIISNEPKKPKSYVGNSQN